MVETKPCPVCGYTMIRVHNYWGTVSSYWWCLKCWHGEPIPEDKYTIWYSYSTGDEGPEEKEMIK